jgi:glycosyltransferase involved in cell wall biosynthesis
MKILMVTPYVPYPPSSGGQIRTLNLLKHLSEKNEITLVALYKNQAERKYYSYLKKYCKKIYLCQRPEKPWQFKNIFKTIFSFYPFLVVRNFSPEASMIIDNLLKKERFDVIHAETFYVMPHIPKTQTPIVLVEQTIEYNVYKHFVNSLPWFLRMLFYFDIDIMKLKYWEKHFWKKADIVVAVSTPDEQIIKSQGYKIKTSVIPNGAGDEMIVKSLTPKKLLKPVVFFQGNFFWLQNVEAAKFIIDTISPLLLKKNKGIIVKIAGQNAEKIGRINNKNIRIVNIAHGDSAKVKKLFLEASIFIAPIFGPGGTRLKILAAMGSGVPVVATDTGVEGLDVADGEHVLIAKSPEEFRDEITNIIMDERLFDKVRKNAYALVKEKYQWKQIASKLESLYRHL